MKTPLSILVLGSGGREHALVWKLRQSPLCGDVYVAPGNAGTALVAQNVPLSATDFPALVQFCQDKSVDLVVVGPEQPLVEGVTDYFRQHAANIPVLGPDAAGARLEGSKEWSKAFMLRHCIPTAAAHMFGEEEIEQALAYVSSHPLPVVVKADGLAAGKGVVVATDYEMAQEAVRRMLGDKEFGQAGARIVVEQFLDGIELSCFALCDGTRYKMLPSAKDYKRIGEGDTGPNTGGMGAVSPVPFADAVFLQKVEERVVQPTLAGLQQEGISYRGFLFIGLMNVGGEPWVIEFNARMGDPETEAVMARLDSDLVTLCYQAATGTLDDTPIVHSPLTAVTVVLAAEGYPATPRKGDVISGLFDPQERQIVFHAGTGLDAQGQVITQGGRVLALTALGETLAQTRSQALAAAESVTWAGRYFRRDIGQDLLAYSSAD